jgi:hypothetical protein
MLKVSKAYRVACLTVEILAISPKSGQGPLISENRHSKEKPDQDELKNTAGKRVSEPAA